jgi:hypothetical protein
MGEAAAFALDIGSHLGLASYWFSINNTGYGAGELGQARLAAGSLSNTVILQIPDAQNEPDVVQIRENVGDQIGEANGDLKSIYQLGLHLGLGQGQSCAESNDWPTASNLMRTALTQAVDDISASGLPFLDPFVSEISSIEGEIGGFDVTNQAGTDVVRVTTLIRNAAITEPSIP